jgi:hypothetical protein
MLESRGLDRAELPLWKLKTKDNEYQELKKELKSAFLLGRYSDLAREAALFYAEWWRRDYSGGTPSKKKITSALEFTTSEIELYHEKLFKLAKSGAKQLHIEPLQGAQNELTFRTLLLQGGIPMKYVVNNTVNYNRYGQLLKNIINDMRGLVDIDLDYLKRIYQGWDDSLLMLGIQIAESIIKEEKERLPFDLDNERFEQLYDSLSKEAHREISKPLTIDWIFCIDNNSKGKLFYKPNCRSKLFVKGEDAYSFKLRLNGKYITKYRQSSDNNYVIDDYSYKDTEFPWNEETEIDIQRLTDSNEIKDFDIPSSFAPIFDEPVLMSNSDGCEWMIKGQSQATKYAVMYPDNWTSANENVRKIDFIDKRFNLEEFETEIKLTNAQDGEERVFRTGISHYEIDFGRWYVGKIKEAKFKVIIKKPSVSLINTVNNIRCQYKELAYRLISNKKQEWKKVDDTTELPNGLIEFRVKTPDQMYEYQKFFYVKDLDIKTVPVNISEGNIIWKGIQPNDIYCCKNEYAEIIKDGLKFTVKQDINNGYFYKDIEFVIQLPDQPTLALKVQTPFRGMVCIDDKNRLVSNNKITTFKSLYGYKFIIAGLPEGDSKPVAIYNSNNSNMIFKFSKKDGIVELLEFQDEIDRLCLLYGMNSFDRESCITIEYDQPKKQIDVFWYKYDTQYNNGKIQISNLYTNKLFVNEDVKLEIILTDLPEINTIPLVFSEDGYQLPEDSSITEGIVVANKDSKIKVIPKFYKFNTNNDLPVELRNNTKKQNIEEWTTKLQQSGSQSEPWMRFYDFLCLALNNELPFTTFNCITAVSRNPNLMVKSLIYLTEVKFGEKEIHDYILKLEKEFAIAFHWIPKETWRQEFERSVDINYLSLLNMVYTISLDLYPNDYRTDEEKREDFLRDNDNEQKKEENIGSLVGIILNPTICFDDDQNVGNDVLRRWRGKICGNFLDNKDLPKCTIPVSTAYFNTHQELTAYQTTCLLSPVKAAESFMGLVDDLWKNSPEVRRTMIFYREQCKQLYSEIFLKTAKMINNRQNTTR